MGTCQRFNANEWLNSPVISKVLHLQPNTVDTHDPPFRRSTLDRYRNPQSVFAGSWPPGPWPNARNGFATKSATVCNGHPFRLKVGDAERLVDRPSGLFDRLIRELAENLWPFLHIRHENPQKEKGPHQMV